MRGAGGDQDALARERLVPCGGVLGHIEELLDRGDDLERLGHAPDTGFAALRHLACVRPDRDDTIGEQRLQIALCRLVAPHARIHRGREQDFSVGREQYGAREIVRVTVRHLGHDVGGRRRDHDQVIVARQANVADVELAMLVEQVTEGLLTRDRADRHRRDELLCGFGHHHTHRNATLAQAADQVERFVRCDAARNDEEDASRRDLRFSFEAPDRLCETFRFRRSSVRRALRQQQPDFLFHRAPVGGGAQTQPRLHVLRQVADRQ